jgi:hypothetical protein
MNPVPPVIEGTSVFADGQWRPKLILNNRNERDFSRYDIYKYSPSTGGHEILLASTNAGEYIDYTEYLLPPGDGPNWNCYYYAKMVDQTSHVSGPSNSATYWVGLPGGCGGCEGDNFTTNNNNSTTPNSFSITNYPNPFNPKTTIKYSIPKDANTSLKIYNALGQLVVTIVDSYQKAGEYEVNFNGENYPSGVYFYRLESGNSVDSKKMLLLK